MGLQLSLTGLDFLWIIDLQMVITMVAGISLLTWASRPNANVDLKKNLAIQTLLVSLFTSSMSAISHIGQGKQDILLVFALPLLYGLCIYLVLYILVSNFHKEDTGTHSYTDQFIQMGLSPRERSIALLIMEGKTNKAIGNQLFIAESTVKKHVQNILRKTQCDNRQEFCLYVTTYK